MALFTTIALGIVVELATIQLADGKTEADLIEASNRFQREFLDIQPGFIRRELVRGSGGEYMDIIHWRSQKDIDAVMAVIESSPAVQAFFAVMKFDTQSPDEGVQYYTSIASFDGVEK